ncbi:PilZ domain-containing protein [Agaribacterium sp. ZY112]|uniref:PilZ domain-containing protein n=1 Tax=Agaribacterium sp. ZY112 TaxID=3233574 RepID=UPI0035263220
MNKAEGNGSSTSTEQRLKPNEAVNDEAVIRRFIRHPSSIPVKIDTIECGRTSDQASIINVSRGGLCFESHIALPKGAQLHISIPIEKPPFEAVGQVAWCHQEGGHYEVGLSFDENCSAYNIRMVEQVCYIEHYRRSIEACEGRKLSSEEAANEWVMKYAADFPPH